jgi:serpin B
MAPFDTASATGRRTLTALSIAALLILTEPLVAVLAQSADQSPGASTSQSPAASVSPSASPLPSPTSSIDPATGLELLVRGRPDPDLSVPDEDLETLVAGNTAFALDLYRWRAVQPGNVVLGPLSISAAMAMNHVGARGNTALETERAMHFDLPTERLDAAFAWLDRDLKALAQPELAISIVSRLFGQRGYPFREEFLAEVSRGFGAPMAVVDFATDPEGVRQLINRWVASQTADRITDLVPPGAIDGLMRLMLVNATYLKAAWDNPFNAAFTEGRPFRLASGRTVWVPTMSGLNYGMSTGRGRGWRAVELPYMGERLAMLIVVPRDLATFEQTLDQQQLAAIVEGLDQESVALTLPTFSARTRLDLKAPLQSLGITGSFQPGVADFSGISDVALADGLHVSAAVHQAFVKVAEQGTEAAAATAIGDRGVSAPPPPFRVNRPFLWFIRDRDTGMVLFLGRVMDPRTTAD